MEWIQAASGALLLASSRRCLGSLANPLLGSEIMGEEPPSDCGGRRGQGVSTCEGHPSMVGRSEESVGQLRFCRVVVVGNEPEDSWGSRIFILEVVLGCVSLDSVFM